MSEHICNLGNFDISCNSVHGEENRSSAESYSCPTRTGRNICLFDTKVGMHAEGNGCHQTKGARRLYQQKEMLRPGSRLYNGCSFSDGIDASFVEELETISSSLTHLLNKTRQRAERNAIFSDYGVPNDTPSWTNENVDDMCSAYGFNTSADDVEKKRYETENSLMNDQIAELQSLLPGHIDRVSWHTTDSILKASVDYIKRHRHDHDRIQQLKDKLRERDLEIRKMMLRLERLELLTAARLTERRGQM
ncbi:microphthalmia-associated transcription factor-like [Mercenaria mercenaria]|uniref:microphthalmia-associated transcription factor-like n=1 Tax=Mercenaria mercenaria TaxID=6596 RepID=UPI00234E82C1|nr:microphthalmia-associated transcription factor-like [Mercenaria mercenaria]